LCQYKLISKDQYKLYDIFKFSRYKIVTRAMFQNSLPMLKIYNLYYAP